MGVKRPVCSRTETIKEGGGQTGNWHELQDGIVVGRRECCTLWCPQPASFSFSLAAHRTSTPHQTRTKAYHTPCTHERCACYRFFGTTKISLKYLFIGAYSNSANFRSSVPPSPLCAGCIAFQVVIPSDVPTYSEVERLSTGASVSVTGVVVESPGKGQRFEVKAQEVR